MTTRLPRACSLAVLCVLPAIARPCSAEDIPVLCTVDYRQPIPPELLKRAHIGAVYVGVGIPVRRDKTAGRAVLLKKLQPQLERFLKLYGEHGIKVLVESNFYSRPPHGTACVDAHGRTIRIGCFNNPKFLDWMSGSIRDMAEAFAPYRAFGGFLFDDGVQVRADCCHCPTCRRLFKEKHGIDPPPFAPVEGTGRLAPDDPRLLWDAFHRDAYARYLRTQAEAARSVSDKLQLVTIPSDSFFFGRHLNATISPAATATTASARLQRIDRFHVTHWHIFQSFPIPRVVPTGSGQRPFATGVHLTTPSPCMILHQEGPLIETMGRAQFLSPAEIGRAMRTTIAEGADAIGFWESARVFPHYPDGFDAIGAVVEGVRGIRATLKERKPFPARVGLLYATATEILQQPWKANTMERWRHLHAFEATAYALTRRSIQFQVVLDSELTAKKLAGLDALILAGVTHLARPVAERLERAIAAGKLAVLGDPTSLPIQGATACNLDVSGWFRSQLAGYRHNRHLDEQASAIEQRLLSKLDVPSLQPLRVASQSCFAKLFRGKGNSLLLFVVNWDTQREAKASLAFGRAGTVTDEATGKALGAVSPGKPLELAVGPGGWRVVRRER